LRFDNLIDYLPNKRRYYDTTITKIAPNNNAKQTRTDFAVKKADLAKK